MRRAVAKPAGQEGEDADLMKALSKIPSTRLALLDDTFALIDSGLGAVLNASMARRVALAREATGRLAADDKASQELRAGMKSRYRLQTAVSKLGKAKKQLQAQQVTMHMMTQFSAGLEDRGPASPLVSEVALSGGKSSKNTRFKRTISEQSEDSKGLERQVSQEQQHLSEDDDFQQWAQKTLGLAGDRLLGLERSATFTQRLSHHMLCWQAMRTDKLEPVRGAKAQRPADGFAGEPTPALKAATKSLFGLVAEESVEEDLVSEPASDVVSPRSRVLPSIARLDAAVREAGPNACRLRARKLAERRMAAEKVSPMAVLGSFCRDALAAVEASVRNKTKSPVHASRLAFEDEEASIDYPPALPRPQSFLEPHCSLGSKDLRNTPAFVYARRCEMAGLVPCQSAWCFFGGSSGVVNARNSSLKDADVRAVVETVVQCAKQGHAFFKLDLGGNSLTDHGLEQVSQSLSEAPLACDKLSYFSLAQNRSLQLRTAATMGEFTKALSTLTALKTLDLSEVKLQGRAAVRLAAALAELPGLARLSLAGCGLGRGDQADCIAVAQLLGPDPLGRRACLLSADLSGNFFGRAGLAAAGLALQNSELKVLSFAGNGGGETCSSDEGKEHQVRFHPMQLLIEGLHLNQKMENLDLSGCGLGPDTAFVAEDALRQHPGIDTLTLMDNPLGESGLRCLIRLVLASASNMSACHVSGHRQANSLAHAVKYRFAQPGGVYSLNLRYPHERATLRTLLRYDGRVSGSTFRFVKFDVRQAKPEVDKDPTTGAWVVPKTGTFGFTFDPPLSSAALQKLAPAPPGGAQPRKTNVEQPEPKRQTLKRRDSWLSSTAVEVLPGGAQPQPQQPPAASAAGSRRKSIFGAVGLEEVAKAVKGMRSRKNVNPADQPAFDCLEGDWQEVGGLLARARMDVSALKFPLIRAMFLSLVTQEQQLRFILACSKDMRFNAAQVSRLSEDVPELTVDILCALLPTIRGRSSQLLLLGDVSSASKPDRVAQATGMFLWFQPGNLTGQYRLNLAEPGDCVVAENCLLVNAWECEVGRMANRPDVSQSGNYELLRNEEHDEVPFKYSRDWNLPSCGYLRFDYASIRRPSHFEAAMPEASEVCRYLRTSQYAAGAKLKALRTISVHMYLCAQQLKNLVLCFPHGVQRQDAFCILHTRVVDPATMLGAACLYSPAVFADEDREALLRRIGHLHLLNPLHPDHIPYACRLAVFEERMVIEFLVQLAAKEAGGKVIREFDDGSCVAVPASWADKGVPCEDTAFKNLRCTYETAAVSNQWRQTLGEKYAVGSFCPTWSPCGVSTTRG